MAEAMRSGGFGMGTGRLRTSSPGGICGRADAAGRLPAGRDPVDHLDRVRPWTSEETRLCM